MDQDHSDGRYSWRRIGGTSDQLTIAFPLRSKCQIITYINTVNNIDHFFLFSGMLLTNKFKGESTMLRKLMVLICLVSFVPAAASAQGIVAAPSAAESALAVPTQLGGGIILSLPAERSAAVLMAAADTSKEATAATAPEHKTEAKRSSFNWGNFAEVHLGDYRWVWWAGAAAALIAIHAGAN
jgi:hypothetical protein